MTEFEHFLDLPSSDPVRLAAFRLWQVTWSATATGADGTLGAELAALLADTGRALELVDQVLAADDIEPDEVEFLARDAVLASNAAAYLAGEAHALAAAAHAVAVALVRANGPTLVDGTAWSVAADPTDRRPYLTGDPE